MAKNFSGLGKGIDAIFLENTVKDNSDKGIVNIKLSQIEAKSNQPRKFFDETALETLSQSIAEHGVLQPILLREIVDGRYQIVAGERRYRAAKKAGFSEIPSIIIDADELQVSEIALIENIQRENLNPIEEATAYRSLGEQFGLTQEEISKKIGKSRSAIANTLRLLDLPEELLSFVAGGELSAGHARALLALDDPADMVLLANKIIEEGLSVRTTENAVKRFAKAKEEEEAAENEAKKPKIVNYARELELKMMENLGRRVKLSEKNGAKSVTLYYEDNEDLENLLKKICGDSFVENL